MFLSCGCCDRSPPTWWVKTTQAYYSVSLEVRSQTRSSLGSIPGLVGLPPFWKLWGQSTSLLSQGREVTCVPWLAAAFIFKASKSAESSSCCRPSGSLLPPALPFKGVMLRLGHPGNSVCLMVSW